MPYKDPHSKEAKACHRRSRLKRRESENVAQRERYAKNREDRRVYFNQWSRDNRDGINKRFRLRYQTDGAFRDAFKEVVTARRIAINKDDRPTIISMRNEDCFYCGEPGGTIDHLIPVIKGGTGDLWNLVPACQSCNSRKHDLTLDEFYKKYPLSI